ncbi:unnamed protein product [Leptosia nina]|uniref:Natalisin n=1 Tax=Leptosia nina TaxID=320188 RepID=A0AAV1J842_9NEOP
MRKKLFVFLILLLASNDIAYGKHSNNTNIDNNKKHKKLNHKGNDRPKRSSNIKTFFQHLPSSDDITRNKLTDKLKAESIEDDAPFWGARGRRESASSESSRETQASYEKVCPPYKKCYFVDVNKNDYPFWANRGRRDDSQSEEAYWDDRIRRQDDDDPFWGSRGRRNEDPPFWGSRGRRYQGTDYSSYDDDDTPFWGNRGRRKMSDRNSIDEPEPFWGNRGKKMKSKPMDEEDPFWATRGKRENDYTNPFISDYVALDNSLKSKGLRAPFWANRGRDSKLKYLFNGPTRSKNKPGISSKEVSVGFHIKPSEQNTVHDDRIFAEEPHYILIERTSRSSMEEDPYIITRGKKYSNRLAKAARDRRGVIEDIVRSVQKDPYYIARGKKNSYIKVGNTIMPVDRPNKDKMFCEMVNSLWKNESKVKREINDPERDRRTILKKLAAQLQADPYFVSRGKKDATDDKVLAFVNEISDMCS